MTTLPAALREAADLLATHDFPYQPYVTSVHVGRACLAWYLKLDGDADDQRASAAAIIRTIGGKWAKAERGEDFSFTARLGLLDLHVQVDRPAVCTRKVTGTETITKVVPAQEAVFEHTVTETVETVEWECLPLLGEGAAA